MVISEVTLKANGLMQNIYNKNSLNKFKYFTFGIVCIFLFKI